MSTRHIRRRLVVLGLVAVSLAAGLPAAAQTKSALLVVLRNGPGSGQIAVVDPATMQIVARIHTGEDPHGVAVSADGRMAFTANTANDPSESVSVVDVVARKEVRRLDFPKSRPHDIQVARGMAFFTAGGRNAIGRHDPVRNQTDWLSTGSYGTRMMAIDEARDTIYATSQSSKSVLILEGISRAPSDVKLTVVPLGVAGEGIAVSPDGREVWTANNDKSGVSIVDVATKKVVTLPLATDHANRIAISPDGRLALLLDREIGELIVFDVASRKEVKRMRPPGAYPGDLMGLGDIAIASNSSHAYVTVQDMDDKGSRSEARQVVGGYHYVAAINLKTLEIDGTVRTDIPGDELTWADMK